MPSHVYHALKSFERCFSRKSSWFIFCAVVLSFLASPEIFGVTSMCRFWLLDESGYHSLLHFFRSKAYSRDKLLSTWWRYVLGQGVAPEVEGRRVLLGDHTYEVKDGGRMPGVVSLHDNSETQSRPSYFRGQCWGAIGLVVGRLSECFCLPLDLRLHLGFKHLGREDKSDSLDSEVKLAERVVQMAIRFATGHDAPVFLVLDAYFCVGSVFRLAHSVYSIALKKPYVEILVRAKKNYVAYFPASPKPPGQRGPQAKYGGKVHLTELFDYLYLFQTVTCRIYGKMEEIQIISAKLMWKPLAEEMLFIFAVTSRGSIVLMSSDLTLSPITAIELYCIRSRIETMFDMLKNLIRAFQFRFWSKGLPSHSRQPVSNKYLKAPTQKSHISLVESCWLAYEIFVLCAAIAQGLLQLMSLRFRSEIWEKHTLYLRTRSRSLPSERTVRQVLTPIIIGKLVSLPQGTITAKIRQYLMATEEDEDRQRLLAA